MNGIVLDGGDVQVDASVVAEGLRLAPALVQPLLRARRIVSRLERGVDEDAGRYRMTFAHGRRQLRLVVDEDGRVLERTTTETARPARATRHDRQGPPAAR